MSAKELYIRKEDYPTTFINLVRQTLKEKNEVVLVSSYGGASVSTRVSNTLVNLNYVSIQNIETVTKVEDEKRKINLRITLKKSPEFDKVNEEYEKLQAEKMKAKEEANKKQN